MLTLFFFLGGFTASKSSCVPLLIIIPLDMYSACTSPGKLIAFFLRLEDELSLVAWCARVPSTSNIADGPSRALDDVPVKFLSAVKIPYSSQFDHFFGAMQKQVCWHLRRLPRPARGMRTKRGSRRLESNVIVGIP